MTVGGSLKRSLGMACNTFTIPKAFGFEAATLIELNRWAKAHPTHYARSFTGCWLCLGVEKERAGRGFPDAA